MATTIAGMVVVTAAAGLRASIGAWQRGTLEADRLDRARAITYAMRVELASIFPRLEQVSLRTRTEPAVWDEVLTTEEARARPFFGGEGELVFVTSRVLSAGTKSPGVHRVRYFVKTDDGGEPLGLYKEVVPYFGWEAQQIDEENEEEPPGKVEFALDPTVVGLSIEYLNPRREEELLEREREGEEEQESVETRELSEGGVWVAEVPEVINVTLDYGAAELRVSVQTGAHCREAEEVL